MTMEIITEIRALQRQVADLVKLMEASAGVHQFGPPLVPCQVQRIIDLVARQHGMEPDAITGSRRHENVCRARHIAIYLCYELLGLSCSLIAQLFHRRDHGTVCHALSNVRAWIQQDAKFADAIQRLREQSKRELAAMAEPAPASPLPDDR